MLEHAVEKPSGKAAVVAACGKINSHNEWDRLREVLVGVADARACVIFSTPRPPDETTWVRVEALARQAYPQWLVDEIREDLEGLCETLRGFDVKVFRPNPTHIPRLFLTPFGWGASGDALSNMRDLHLVVGNTVIESPSQERHRYFEAVGLYDIWYQYFKEGFRWIAGPKPRLPGTHMIPYFENGQRYIKLSEDEILFEAANTVRMGRDLLYLVSRSGNNLGAQWLQSVVGEDYRVHTTDQIYRSSHIDSTVLCLRPGLVLLNAQRVNPSNCPTVLERWDKIYFDEIVPTPADTLQFQETVRTRAQRELAALGVETSLDLASDWIGMNVLSVDPGTVLVDERQVPLIKVLERHKITPVPIRFRHSYMMGGIHCNTLDTVRESRLERYV